MALSFPNISTLGVQQQARFFQAGFNYSAAKTYAVAGYVTDLTNAWGVTGIWTGINTTIANANDYQPLLLNGVNFGSGRIESISFDPGVDVKTKTYSASISVLDSGNLFNFTGTYYSGINLGQPQYLDAFDEGWDLQKKVNGGYSYTHNATIRFTSGVGQLNAIEAAKAAARTLFTGSHLGFAFYSGTTDKQGKRFFTESYNLIDNTCSFSDSFDFDSNRGSYSVTRTNTVDLDEGGVILAVERGNVRGIENVNYQNALGAVAGEMTGSYYRCSGVAAAYFSGHPLLYVAPLVQGRSFDLFNNTLVYSVSFNNNPNNSGTYFWDYTQQVSRQSNIGTITENGTVQGRGGNPSLSFVAGQAGFVTVKAGIPGRASGLFLTNFSAATNYQTDKQESYSPHQGRVGYGYTYSNDPHLIAGAGIRRKEVIVDTARPIYLYNKVDIFNNKQIAQDDKQATIGTAAVSVNMEGDKTVALPSFLAQAVADVNANAPVGNDRHVGDANYTYDPVNGTVNARVTWVYNASSPKNVYP